MTKKRCALCFTHHIYVRYPTKPALCFCEKCHEIYHHRCNDDIAKARAMYKNLKDAKDIQ